MMSAALSPDGFRRRSPLYGEMRRRYVEDSTVKAIANGRCPSQRLKRVGEKVDVMVQVNSQN
jgi:hypothetical protein